MSDFRDFMYVGSIHAVQINSTRISSLWMCRVCILFPLEVVSTAVTFLSYCFLNCIICMTMWHRFGPGNSKLCFIFSTEDYTVCYLARILVHVSWYIKLILILIIYCHNTNQIKKQYRVSINITVLNFSGYIFIFSITGPIFWLDFIHSELHNRIKQCDNTI